MNKKLFFKLGQIAGAVFMIAGVAACNMNAIEKSPMLFLIGGVLYGGCRMAAWLTAKD